MTQANFKFISEAADDSLFSVVSFTGREAISSLYEYQIEIRAPLSASILLDDVLDSAVKFITEVNGIEYPVHGILSNFEELQTVQDYVHYKAVLVPRLWSLSIYKTNEIYTEQKTVDQIIETVLENAGLVSGTDYDMSGLIKDHLLSRDYVCQFGESDFDFISRLMENEGIFYYFDQSGDGEKIIFINDMNYEAITRPGLIFEVTPSTSKAYDCIHTWSCRKQRLAGAVTVRDFNPDHPSMDIAETTAIDQMSQGTDYYYGENIQDVDEATYLSEIRAEESLCKKTRYYGESSVSRLQAGYLFEMEMHPNELYNKVEYLALEVNHEGQNLDISLSTGQSGNAQLLPGYRNNFVAIAATDQYRPPRMTPKPRFYGTMTGFIYAESITGRGVAEVDEQGRYRVHLPFDRADGAKDSSDPNRKASTWIRMAQPYAGKDEGMCFPLEGGTEVLLTFINGDPDQPIISAALPNASTPSLLTSETAHMASIVTPGAMVNKSYGGSYTNRSIPVVDSANQASASVPPDEMTQLDSARGYGPVEGDGAGDYRGHFMPPADFTTPLQSNYTQFKFAKLNDYGQANEPDPNLMPETGSDADTDDSSGYDLAGIVDHLSETEEDHDVKAHIDRSTGPAYVHRVGSTFAYPQQERVYFCGTFHEDFHMDDMGVIGKKRLRDDNWIMTDVADLKVPGDPQGPDPEVFHFPEPGEDGTQPVNPLSLTDDEKTRFQPNRVRGVSEDKRWGDQMNYAWGRSFNWAGGPEMGGGDSGSFGEYNYGNSYTENLQTLMGGTSSDSDFDYPNVKDEWNYTPEGTPDVPFNFARVLAPITIGINVLQGPVGLAGAIVKGGILGASLGIHETGNDLTQAWQLQPGSTAVEKTFGHTFSYQMGLAIDIHEGNSMSKTYGHSVDWVNGNSESYTQGDNIATTLGTSSEAFVGSKYEFNFATVDELTIAAVNETFLGAKTEIAVGLNNELKLSVENAYHFGFDVGLQVAGFLKATMGFGIDRAAGKINTEDIELKDTKAKIVADAIGCAREGQKFKAGTLGIVSRALSIIC